MQHPYSTEVLRRARKREVRKWLLFLLTITIIIGVQLLSNAWAGTRRAQTGEVSRWDNVEPFPGMTLTLEKSSLSRWHLLGRTVKFSLHNDTDRTLRYWSAYLVDKGIDPMGNPVRLEYKVNGVWRRVITNLPEKYSVGDLDEALYGYPLSSAEILSYPVDFNLLWGNCYEPGEYRLVMFVSEDGVPASEAQPVFAAFTIK